MNITADALRSGKQYRTYDLGGLHVRTADDGSRIYAGYAAKYNSLSEKMYFGREMIAPGAFDGRLNDDVRLLINHQASLVLGRNAVGLTLSLDDVGLAFECPAPATSYSNDLIVVMDQKIVTQCSFGFDIAEEHPETTPEDERIWVIDRIERLWDVSIVTYPAYPDTEALVRSSMSRSNLSPELAERAAELLEAIAKSTGGPEGTRTDDVDPVPGDISRNMQTTRERRIRLLELGGTTV